MTARGGETSRDFIYFTLIGHNQTWEIFNLYTVITKWWNFRINSLPHNPDIK